MHAHAIYIVMIRMINRRGRGSGVGRIILMMELRMGWNKKNGVSIFSVFCGILAVAALSCACTKDKPAGAKSARTQEEIPPAREQLREQLLNRYEAALESGGESPAYAGQAAAPNREALLFALENIIELERSGGFVQGMGIRESIFRENLGDYAGAVTAAYKELAWAYGMGMIDKGAMEQGLQNALKLGELPSRAARGCIAFVQGKWADAEQILRDFKASDEIDSIVQWMILSCALEQNRNDKQAADSYRAIRSRYSKFPEYWYRGARVFSGAISMEYAEHCIALSPSGPFADECRSMLARNMGLNPKDGPSLLSRPEIERLISSSINQGDPKLLDPLMPLIALPDNSYTIYAVGALRSLAPVPIFRDYFRDSSDRASGRLAERLSYISQAGL